MYEVDQYTVSLLHFDDGLKDECGNQWSFKNYTGAGSNNSEQKKIGTGSLYLDGAILQCPNTNLVEFGVGDFTIDFWVYTEQSSDDWLFGRSWHLDNFLGIMLGSDNHVKVYSYLDNNSTGALPNSPYMNSTAILSLNNWHHIALVRYNNVFNLFIDGKLDSQKQSNANLTSTDTQPIAIGGYTHEDVVTVKKVYFDEFRISKIARWTSDFTPPAESRTALLRITMSDSSEREYEVNTDEFNNFLAWFNRTIGTGTNYYSFDKTVGTQSSTEYLAFDKIISFKTMNVNNQVVLKIIMSDSSEREYKVSSADDFVNWHNRTVASCDTSTTHYEFTDGVDGSTEYLSFDKIISFEVMPLTK
ncbi:hypothetical protein Ga0466249_003417 [Sporomusaceae bacterium BoRhaA]|uniref:LamG domain-containing protein n=1 Tax=Pelorhabdus rhamnosifermentans TaxID=2772457 RepID=UPI001C05FFED|nr:LamG domain-containing protein [Pelorhabdus rhamnosifermentans]MBU2702290.1 hypothetical protein [Pelorhabdus rhamnosifermentans]